MVVAQRTNGGDTLQFLPGWYQYDTVNVWVEANLVSYGPNDHQYGRRPHI